MVAVGFMHFADCMVISKDSSFDMKTSGINILAVTRDSVTFEVKGTFTKDGNPVEATIRRGETQKYEDVRRATATIYGDDYDYTVEDLLEVVCI